VRTRVQKLKWLGWVTAVLCLLGTSLLAACAKPVAQDAYLTFGDGGVHVHVPAKHGSIGVVVLHSLHHTYTEGIDQGWSKLADEKGFTAIYPGRDGAWNAGLCCAGAATTERDDVSWLTNVINTTKDRYHLKKIYLVGNSNGGMMVERLLAERPYLSDRFAVWASAPEMPTPGRWYGTGIIFDGVKDKTVPRAGGRSYIGGHATIVRPASATKNWLVGANLRQIVVPGAGHVPEPGWPTTAWRELTR
jgi:poly(3-hydroxybutyrate) depolymerase